MPIVIELTCIFSFSVANAWTSSILNTLGLNKRKKLNCIACVYSTYETSLAYLYKPPLSLFVLILVWGCFYFLVFGGEGSEQLPHVTRFAKRVLYTYSFKSPFSLPFDGYNNRLTVHAYTIAKGSMVYFYWGLIHGPVCCPRMLRWSVSGPNLPGQANSQQGITTRLAGETGHRCSCILWYVELKTAWIEAIWWYNFFESEGPTTLWLPTTPHPYRTACGIDYLVK